MKMRREQWFREFQKKKQIDAESLWNFHVSAGVGDPEIDVIMDRGFVKTQNITQIENLQGKPKMRFMDLRDRNKIEVDF